MTPAQFKKKYWPDIEAACRESGLNPLFVAAQAALETGWGQKAIGRNLFGITHGKGWRGAVRIVRTTEYLPDDRQGNRFIKVHSIERLPDGRYKYTVDRAFRDYPSVRDCLLDHFRVLSGSRYKAAFAHVNDVYRFALEIARAGYCTAPPEEYAQSIASIAKTLERL